MRVGGDPGFLVLSTPGAPVQHEGGHEVLHVVLQRPVAAALDVKDGAAPLWGKKPRSMNVLGWGGGEALG